jgi:subtilisin family serine protease
MKLVKILALCLLAAILATGAQAGYLTKGLESQLAGKADTDHVKVLVVLRDQTDIKTLDWDLHAAKADLSVRHSVVLETLQDTAKKSQGDLLRALEADKAAGDVLGYTPHWIVNSVVVVATPPAIRELAARDDVERVEADLVVELIEPLASQKALPSEKDTRGIGMTPGLQAINAPRVWNELGIDGSGVIIGMLDTGVDGNHPALAARWRGNFAPAEECWLDAANLGDTDFPVDQHYHGTHVMGTMTGLAADDTIGVAPGALWIASNIINSSASDPAFDNGVIASLEFMADPDGDPATTIDMPVVVQNSWGVNESFSGYYDCDSRWWDAIDACEAAGVVLTWSAGNEGSGSETLRSPADRAASPTNAFSVGSTIHSPPYTISDFSSRGPSGCGGDFAMKPEVAAPGSDIYSAEPGGGYQYLSGTSMAGPHVAGVVALMRASNPNVDVITVKEVLMATATDLGTAGEDNDYGHGLINAYEAVLAVMGGIGTVEGTVTDSGTGLPLEGVLVQKVGGYNQDITDANGYFSMTMPAEEVTLSFSKFGYGGTTAVVTIPEDASVTQDAALDLLPTGTVSGIVYGPTGDIVVGAEIRVIDTPVAPVYSGADGSYAVVLPAAAGNFYDLQGRATGMGAVVQNVEVAGDVTLDFNLPEWIGDDFESGNFNRFPWEMTGATGWVIDTAVVYEGFNSARSGAITHNQDSEMGLTLDFLGEGDMSFYYKVSSESGWDYLRFYVDGAMIAEWSGEVDWSLFTHPMTAGSHTIRFAYEKDGSVSSGSDCGWIDFMELPAVELPGVPDIDMDMTPMAVSLDQDATRDEIMTINNLGDGSLTYYLDLREVGPSKDKPINPVPYREFAKNERDDRDAVSPLTGFGGPDVFGYTWKDSDEAGGPTYNWIDISVDGEVVGSGDDSNHGPFSLQFPFSYYGDVHNEVRVCTNGFLSFTSSSTSYNNQGIPNSGDPNNLLAVFWDDLNPNQGGTIYYRSEPNRFIVQWQDVPHYSYDGSGLPVTFQVILDADGSITYQYALVQDIDGSTVGIENAAGDDGLLVCFNDAGYLHDELAIRLAPTPPLTWVTADHLFGTVAEGASADVTLHFDSTGMELGAYHAQLTITSDDPDEDTLVLPITMNVTDGVAAVGDALPQVVQLRGAVPNPFNPMTEIKFSIPADASVNLKLYDVSGRLVRNLMSENLESGQHSVTWNGRDDSGRSVASGTYFARLVVDGVSSVKSMVLVR